METKIPYWQKLQDPRWQKLRLEIFQRDMFTCRRCGDSKHTLAVHHPYYISGRDPWQYPKENLFTLCETCHKIVQVEDTAKVTDWEILVGLHTISGDALLNELMVIAARENKSVMEWVKDLAIKAQPKEDAQ